MLLCSQECNIITTIIWEMWLTCCDVGEVTCQCCIHDESVSDMSNVNFRRGLWLWHAMILVPWLEAASAIRWVHDCVASRHYLSMMRMPSFIVFLIAHTYSIAWCLAIWKITMCYRFFCSCSIWLPCCVTRSLRQSLLPMVVSRGC